jgi:hypothetical protein
LKGDMVGAPENRVPNYLKWEHQLFLTKVPIYKGRLYYLYNISGFKNDYFSEFFLLFILKFAQYIQSKFRTLTNEPLRFL